MFSRATGTFQADHIRRAHLEGLELQLVLAGKPFVHDMRFVDFHVRTSEVMTVRDLPFSDHSHDEKRRIAFIAGSTLGYGMLRIVAALRDFDGQMTDVFHDFRSAFDWIHRPELGETLPADVDRFLAETDEDGEAADEFGIVIRRA